jgi:fructose-1,6-bisphosphatase/inositol monophosphatase family enzyme
MIDPEMIANFIRDTARAIILPRFRALGIGDIREKKPGDPVTIADIESERELTRLLTGMVPDAHVLGEESVADNPAQLDLLSTDAPVWIIDPVDGTANFVKGNPGFAVIVALTRGGQVEGGWIHNPVADTLIWALKGQGAWMGSRRLAVASHVPPERLAGSAYGKTKSGARAARAINESGRVLGVHNQGCSGIEYMLIAQGLSQFSLHSRSLPWDHAAGTLIVEEAGGYSRFLGGSAYDTRIPDRSILTTSTQQAWQTIHDIVETA